MNSTVRAALAKRLGGRASGSVFVRSQRLLRHTFASPPAVAGVDPATIQNLGGWRSLRWCSSMFTCRRRTSPRPSSGLPRRNSTPLSEGGRRDTLIGASPARCKCARVKGRNVWMSR